MSGYKMQGYTPKIVMITGATGGFGMAFAHRFAELGCKLILTSRKEEELKRLTAGLKVPVHGLLLDMRDRKAIEAAFAGLPSDFQDIDVLVNNAGGAFGLDPVFKTELDDWENMIEVNNLGLVVATRLALPRMVERKEGHIINIGSVAGSYAYPGGSVYAAVKAFVKQFSLSIRADLIATKVRVTNIEPGLAETPFSLNRFKGDKARADQVYSGANPLTADDIAETVVWAATLPRHVNINRIEVMPVTQASGPFAIHRE